MLMLRAVGQVNDNVAWTIRLDSGDVASSSDVMADGFDNAVHFGPSLAFYAIGVCAAAECRPARAREIRGPCPGRLAGAGTPDPGYRLAALRLKCRRGSTFGIADWRTEAGATAL